jgi:dTMP kinase
MSPPVLRHGIFITFEGGEGAGKSSLIEEVARQLASEGYSVVKTREPGSTHLGEHIRSILLNHSSLSVSPYAELCLFLAARAQHIQEVIAPSLEKRKIILCDRYNDSTIAYQGAARGLGLEKVERICNFICQGLQPILTLYLDIDPAVGLSRARGDTPQGAGEHDLDRIESEGIPFHSLIREAFREIHEKDPYRFRLLDASQPQEIVTAEAMQSIRPLLT